MADKEPEKDAERDARPATSDDAAGRSGSEDAAASAAREGAPMTQQLGRVVLIVAAVLFGVFAVTNAQYVEFSWVFGGTEVVERGGERASGGVPLIVLLLASFAIGALIAWIVTLRSERRKR